MHDGSFHISGRTRLLSLSAAIAVLLFLSVISARTFMGAYYYGKVPGILDDRSTEESVTIKELSAETVPAYQVAIETFERAIFYDPSRALYRKALSESYARLGSWSETMELLNMPLPQEAFSSAEAFERAAANIREAIRRQPTNSDNHLAYSHLAWMTNNLDAAQREYERTINSYPWNSALRYAVIMEYLIAGMNADVLKQAIELARIDDSYKMPDTVVFQTAVERRTPFYVNRLRESYLYKAFEIIWRTSRKDVAMVQAIVPDNDEAQDAFELFVEAKGVIDK